MRIQSFISWSFGDGQLRTQRRRFKRYGGEKARLPSSVLAGRFFLLWGSLAITALLFGPDLAAAQETVTDPPLADSQNPTGLTTGDAQMCPLRQGSLLVVTLSKPLRWAEWHPGSLIEGQFLRPAYSGGQIVIPSKSQLILEIDHVTAERVKDRQAQHWPARMSNSISSLVQREYSHSVAFRSARVIMPSGNETRLHVSLVSAGERTPARARKKTSPNPGADMEMKTAAPDNPGRHSQLIVRLEEQVNFPVRCSESGLGIGSPTERTKVPAGTQARLLLLTELCASRNHAGDSFRAQLMEPIWLDSRIGVPEGSMFEGQVTKSIAPRCLNRGGRLHLDFRRLILPSGSTVEISASLNGAESDIKSQLNLDIEGDLSAGRQGKVALLVHLGISWLAGKVVDDLIEEGIKWGASSVSAATAATVARYFGIGTGVALMVLQHGKDTRLSQYAELQVIFNRPVFLGPSNLGVEKGQFEETQKMESQAKNVCRTASLN
ncbi:MAG TPA: hypothetical protein VMW38_18945 [Terriglobia bacterium]|nr:hypothetical protein [Terriglobia bacterium]